MVRKRSGGVTPADYVGCKLPHPVRCVMYRMDKRSGRMPADRGRNKFRTDADCPAVRLQFLRSLPRLRISHRDCRCVRCLLFVFFFLRRGGFLRDSGFLRDGIRQGYFCSRNIRRSFRQRFALHLYLLIRTVLWLFAPVLSGWSSLFRSAHNLLRKLNG